MPVHQFVEVAEEECSYCPECSYVLIPDELKAWPEHKVIELLIVRQLDAASARTLVGSWLVGYAKLAPSSEALRTRLEDILQAARVAGWRPADEEETRTMPMPLEDRREQLARQYSQTHKVSIERGRAAVLAGHDAPPVPVDPVSQRLDAKVRQYVAQHALSYAEAFAKVAELHPELAKSYVDVPVFPKHTSGTELTQDELLAALSLNDLLSLCVNRKLGVTDDQMRLLVYEWFVTVDGRAHGSKDAADAADGFWVLVKQERFKKEGFGGQNATAPGR